MLNLGEQFNITQNTSISFIKKSKVYIKERCQ